jgi:hypothetical protein
VPNPHVRIIETINYLRLAVLEDRDSRFGTSGFSSQMQ